MFELLEYRKKKITEQDVICSILCSITFYFELLYGCINLIKNMWRLTSRFYAKYSEHLNEYLFLFHIFNQVQ